MEERKGCEKIGEVENKDILVCEKSDESNEEINKEIKRRESLIQRMKDDEKIYGLVGEDFENIKKWKGEIAVLKQKLK